MWVLFLVLSLWAVMLSYFIGYRHGHTDGWKEYRDDIELFNADERKD